MSIDHRRLIKLAGEARANAYSPYSGFSVGAALLCGDGRVFTGCNIENAAYGPSVCAERVALFSAVSQGVRIFAAIAIVGGKAGESADGSCPPCGVCRQALSEFCEGEHFEVILGSEENPSTYKLKELLPLAFTLK